MTTRREFLRSAGLLATLPGLFPVVVSDTPYSAETLRAFLAKVRQEVPLDDYYTIFIPPLQAIPEPGPRERWDMAYRRYRVARQEGVCGYLPASDILNRFYVLKDGTMPSGEVGSFEGVRFIGRSRPFP